jgi:3-oxoacyl-[acyl-carrier protein] reductase
MQRHVVVSGGGTGIGRATARLFAREGARVTLLGRRANVLRDAAAELQTAGAAAVHWHALDLADANAVTELARSWDEPVDVLVNNAGGADRRETPDLTTVAEQWLADFRTNVLTAVLLTTALVERLRRPGGRVILLSSIAALRGGGGSYSAAKAALHGWAFDLAADLGPDGITVNVVAPGFVDETEFFAGTMTDARRARLVDGTLVKRAGRPEDVAALIGFLASPEAGYVTAQIVQSNGGTLPGR